VASGADAELAVARMGEMSPDLRGCAVLDGNGNVLASSAGSGWRRAGVAFLEAADAAEGARASHVHVATEDGEVFAVREGGLAMVAVSDRFTLASLMLFDMRTILRDLARGEGVPDRRAPGPAKQAPLAPTAADAPMPTETST
jgi:hypothetical protein